MIKAKEEEKIVKSTQWLNTRSLYPVSVQDCMGIAIERKRRER